VDDSRTLGCAAATTDPAVTYYRDATMTPVRAVLSALAVISGLIAVFALFIDDSQTKLPLLVASLAVFAICVGVLGFALAGSAARSGEDGRFWRALGIAFVGGIFVLVAAGSLAMAIVLGILAGGVA